MPLLFDLLEIHIKNLSVSCKMVVILFRFKCLALWKPEVQVLNEKLFQRLLIVNNHIHIYLYGCLNTHITDGVTAKIMIFIPHFKSINHLLIDYYRSKRPVP